MQVDSSSAKVLVCDDEPDVRQLVRVVLEERGYDVEEARDGDEAIELVRTLRPDVVLLDLMMPGRGGLAVLSAIRSDPELSETRVVVFSAARQTAERLAGVEAGADAHLGKPFEVERLESIVASLAGPGRPRGR